MVSQWSQAPTPMLRTSLQVWLWSHLKAKYGCSTNEEEQDVVLWGSLEVGKEQHLLLLRSPENTVYALSTRCQRMPSLLTGHSSGLWPGARVLVRGILTGEQAAGKYPIVRIDQIHTGSEIENLKSLSPDRSPDGLLYVADGGSPARGIAVHIPGRSSAGIPPRTLAYIFPPVI